MAVDYAAKKWEQPDKKWALRNAKLRMSRKLLFVAGLLLCFSFELDPPPHREEILADEDMMPASLADFFLERVKRKPIDVLCRLLLRQSNREVVLDILDSYDQFLALLSDGDKRDHLAKLQFEAADRDVLFAEVRALSDRFQEGLTSLFYRDDEKLRDLIVKYGVF